MKNGYRKMALALSVAVMCAGTGGALAEDALSTILNAGTTQAFSDEAIDEADLNAILEAGLSATSAINQQPWYFVALTNAEIMAEIADSSGFGGIPSGGKAPGDFEIPEGKSMPENMKVPEGGEQPEVGAPEGMEIPEGWRFPRAQRPMV